MPTSLRSLFRGLLVGACLAALAGVASAEVTRVDVRSRADLLGGRPFGDVGAYEVLSGTIYFAVDPNNAHNRIIVDVDKAPRNAQGKVEFSSDLFMLRPKDSARGNGVLLFDVVNRGNKGLMGVFSRAARGTEFKTEAEVGDGYLLKQGYTLVFVGWQFDIAPGKGQVGFSAPVATENGAPIKGWVRMPFLSDKSALSIQYGAGYNTSSYLPVSGLSADSARGHVRSRAAHSAKRMAVRARRERRRRSGPTVRRPEGRVQARADL
jgi:hypothetical protein